MKSSSPRIALVTYPVKPRGGVVHTLELAEALGAAGADVTVIGMGDPEVGFFRPVAVPTHIVPAPEWGDTLEERVFRWIGALTTDLTALADRFDVVHAQDCISARAAARVRDGGAGFVVVRTVHHVDDFTTQALIDCQNAAILEPDVALVVSEQWQRILAADHDREAAVVTNGVRADRFATAPAPGRVEELRASIGAEDRFLFLSIGGIEPRKGSEHLVAALARLKAEASPDRFAPVVAIIGGHSFQDYREYRARVLGSLDEQGLVLGEDLVLLGTQPDEAVVDWMHAADAFVFPSVNEGWGLAPLEAMAAGLAVVASDLPVFQEFLTDETDALLTATGDAVALAAGMRRLQADEELRRRLAAHGPTVAARFPWSQTAQQHLAVYGSVSTAP